MYIITDKKEKIELEIRENKIKNLKHDYYLYFKCLKCGKETRRQGGQYKRTYGIDFKDIDLEKEEYFLCMVCYSYKKNFELYGINNIFEKKEVVQRIQNIQREKNKIKFGKSLLVKEKIIFSCEVCGKEIEKTFRSFRKNKMCKSCSIIYYNEDEKCNKLLNSIPSNIIPLFRTEEYAGIRKNNMNIMYKFKCETCGFEFEDHFHSNIPHCIKCVESGTSLKEKEVFEFISTTLKKEAVLGDRKVIKPKELDIYIPEYNLGIEFDGLFWHNNIHVDKYYHYNKTTLAKEKKVSLIHIFEDEWDNKQEIVKSIIKSRLNLYDKIIYARNCILKEISKEEEKFFLNNNHIQGYVPSKICLGLYYENELISLMTFGKSRFNKNYKWELLRFVNKINYKVIGGASKLFKKADLNNIISYCDLRYFSGNLYEKLGFSFFGQTQPNYYYVKNKIRYSRLKFQKHKLKNILENFNSSVTEEENMYNNGYTRIYDCGNLVFVKKE